MKPLSQALIFIEMNLGAELSLRRMADFMGCSPNHFSRWFARQMYIPFTHYVTQKRIEASCRLLADSELSIAQIAYACGFSSQAHFSKVFRQTMHTSPKQYRNRSLSSRT